MDKKELLLGFNNLMVSAACYVPKEDWDKNRVEVIAEIRRLIKSGGEAEVGDEEKEK